jgi:hypothetical protein
VGLTDDLAIFVGVVPVERLSPTVDDSVCEDDAWTGSACLGVDTPEMEVEPLRTRLEFHLKLLKIM